MMFRTLGLLLLMVAVRCQMQAQCPYRDHGELGGDVVLGFMFPFLAPYNHGNICSDVDINDFSSVQLVEAALFAVNELNNNNMIPGVTVGLEAWDSCYSSTVATDRGVSFLYDRKVSYEQNVGENCRNQTKAGVIADLRGDRGPAVGSLLSDAQSPVISYAATLPSLTSSGFDFFSRVIPSDQTETKVIVDLLVDRGWRYISLVYSDTLEERAEAEIFQEEADKAQICIATLSIIQTDSSSINDAILKILNKPEASVVVIFLSSQDFINFVIRIPGSSSFQFVVGHAGMINHGDLSAPLNLNFLAVSPTSLDTSVSHPFDDYFKSLSPDTVDAAVNRWFVSFYEQSYQCSISGGTCGTAQQVQHEQDYVRNPYALSVIDSVNSMGMALQNLHSTKCFGIPGPCPAFMATTPQEMQEAIRNINFENSASQEISFNRFGNPNVERYTIWRLPTATRVPLTKIGMWEDGRLSLEQEGTDILSSIVSDCGVNCLDPLCLKSDNSTDITAQVDGDVLLAGMFAVREWDSEKDRCVGLTPNGVIRLEAMLYAVDKINNDPSILPTIKLGIEGMDTCGDAQRAGHQAVELVSKYNFGRSSSGTQITDDDRKQHLYGIIGPGGNEETSAVTSVVKTYGVTVIGYEADSHLLSSTQTSPNFVRVVPTYINSFFAIGTVLRQWNFRYVQVLLSSENFPLNSVIASYFRTYEVCVAQRLEIPQDDNSWDEIFDSLGTKPDAKAIFIDASPEDIQRFMGQIRDRGLIGEYFLITGDGWLLDEGFTSGLEDVAQGTLAVKTSPRIYTGFQNYFASLSSTYTRNPWFQRYWMQRFQCVLPGQQSEFTTPCTGTESLDPRTDVNDETAAYVIDAVYTLAEALHRIHTETCGSSNGVCDAMDILTGEEVFASITLKTVTSKNEDNLIINIGYTGDAQIPYHVYNNQRGISPEVATFFNYMLHPLPSQPAKFYNSDGTVRTSEIYSVCNKTKCFECESVGRDQVAATRNGDIWIGGFFEVSEPESTQIECSDRLVLYNMQLVEAFLFAIDEINKDMSILPNLTLGGIAFDSCGSKKRVGKEVGNFYSGTVDYRPGYNPNRINIAGMIGGGTSDTTQALSNTLVNLDVNAISYGATASTFSNPKMFGHLLRTVPSDEKQAMAMADVMVEFGWKYVSVVYSDNVYGNDILELFTKAAAKKNICIAMTLVISKSTSSSKLDSFIDSLQTNVNARTVILLTSDLDTRSVLQAADKRGVQNIQWVGGDTWGSRDYIIAAAENTALGAVTLQFKESETLGFRDYFAGLNAYNNIRNPWWRKFWSDTFECNLVSGRDTYDINCPFHLQSLANGFVQAPEVTYVFNAVKALANGLHEALKELCPGVSNHLCNELMNDPDAVVGIIRKSSFVGGDNTTFRFDSKGDGPAEYDILNIQPGVNDTLQYAKIGSWNNGALSLSGTPTQLYREGRQVGNTNTMCSGRCEECGFAQESVRQVVSLPGELQIPVLIGVHSSPTGITQTCGELREAGLVNVEAVLYAVNAINADNSILRNVKLGTTILDTCLSPGQGLSKLSSYLERTGDFSEDTEWRHVAGIIGAEDDIVTQFTSSIADQFEYVQIAYSSVDSSNSQFLLQTSASRDQQLQVIQDILDTFGWNFVSLVSDGTDTQHVQLAEAIYSSQGEQKFCIENNLKYERTGFSELRTSLEGSESNVIILVMSLETADRFAGDLRLERDVMFVVINTYPPSSSARLFSSLNGALVVTFPQVSNQFMSHLASLPSGQNPWYDEFIEGNVGQQLSATTSINVNNIIDAVYAMASGISSLVDQKCRGGSAGLCSSFLEVTTAEVLNTMSNREFISDGGQRVTMQNGTVSRSFNIWTADSNGKLNMVGSWTGGTLDINSETTTSKRMIKSSKMSCKSQSMTGGTLTQIRPKPVADELWFLIAMILCGVGIIISVIFLIAILIQHHSPQAQVYSLFLCCTLLVFIILLFGQNVFFGFAPSSPICALRRLCFGIFHTLAFLAVFLMTVRFYRILAREKRITGPRTLYINNKSQAILFVLLGIIEVLIVVQSLLFQPPDATGNLGYCQYMDGRFPVSLLYLFFLMVATLVVSILALCRSKTILSRELTVGLFCIIICIIVVAAWIVCGIVTDVEQEISIFTIVTCFVSIILGYILLFFLIPFRVYNLWRRHDPFSDSASVVSGEFNPPRSNDYDTTINQAVGGEVNPTYDDPPTLKNMNFETNM